MCGSKTEGNFQVQSPRGAYIWRGLYVEGFFFGILRYLFNPFTAKWSQRQISSEFANFIL